MAKSTQKKLPLPPPNLSPQPVYGLYPARVESEESLGLVLAEMARLKAIADRLVIDVKERQDAINLEASGKLVVVLENAEQPITFADRVEELEAAAGKFCRRNRETLIEEGRKSRDFTHGRVGFEWDDPGIDPLDDFDSDGNLRIPEEVLGELREFLNKERPDLARFLDVKVSWRKSALSKAFIDKEIGLGILRRAGFQPHERVEEFYVKLFVGKPVSASAEKAK